ncbi:hypothetical protein Bca52824_088918 [Brassica carinata]|uniref:Pentatricopeptide repeat-containing protein n=1 Tax=Brassica carinata TaxID=52824 RepID=A0A8X7PDN1_BRACI|nr:hypothetical protein Bca52824_088918 [Brassica carinata]
MSTTCTSTPLPILTFTERAKSLSEIQQAHAFMLKTGLSRDTFSASKLISFAVSNPEPQTVSAHSILTRIDAPNAFAHNSLIRAYANSSTPETALTAFREMLLGPVDPDKYSFTFALKACAAFRGVEEGRQIHGLFLKSGLVSDVYVENTLVNVYGRSGWFEVARKVLDGMPERDVVSWNSLLSAFVEKGLVEEAREVFDEMEERNVESWNFMVSGYAAAGLVEEAREVFEDMPVKDVVSWNAMVSGYARAGCYGEALEVFNEMLKSCTEEPDGFTFVSVLSACANLGSLSQELVNKVPPDEASVLLESLLGACKRFGRTERAESIANRLLELNPGETSGYVQMSNLYASNGRWDEVMDVRKR